VMQAEVADRDVIIVLLDAMGNNSRANDAARIKAWLEETSPAHGTRAHYTAASRT